MASRMNLSKRNQLVLENQGLIYMVVKRFKNYGIDFLDLVQAGNEGLIIASRKYDPKRPSKFSTMAVWWIKKHVMKIVLERQLVHVPYQVQWDEVRRIQEDRKVCAKTGKRPVVKRNNFETCEYDDSTHAGSQDDTGMFIRQLIEMSSLTDSEKDIIDKFYTNDVSFRDIAERRKISKQRVCALHKRALSKMRYAYDQGV